MDGLSFVFSNAALSKIAVSYTQEAGVRSLEKEIAKICRKIAMVFMEKSLKPPPTIEEDDVPKYLGVSIRLLEDFLKVCLRLFLARKI